MIVSASAISALQRVKVSTADSAIVTLNSSVEVQQHLQPSPARGVRKNLSFAVLKGCMFPVSEE